MSYGTVSDILNIKIRTHARTHTHCRYMSHFQGVHRGQFFTTMKTTTVRKLLPESWVSLSHSPLTHIVLTSDSHRTHLWLCENFYLSPGWVFLNYFTVPHTTSHYLKLPQSTLVYFTLLHTTSDHLTPSESTSHCLTLPHNTLIFFDFHSQPTH